MAGSFVTIVNPGYSALFTRDLAAVSNSNISSSATVNLFDPDVTNPLQEGEWLQIDSNYKFSRGAGLGGAVTGSGTATALQYCEDAQNVPASTPCFMYFQERGRYDAQVTRKAHCIVGPAGFEFRTKMIVTSQRGTTASVGDRVFVVICEDSSGRLVQALISESVYDAIATAVTAVPAMTDAAWCAGVITRIHGTNDCTVLFQPGYHG